MTDESECVYHSKLADTHTAEVGSGTRSPSGRKDSSGPPLRWHRPASTCARLPPVLPTISREARGLLPRVGAPERRRRAQPTPALSNLSRQVAQFALRLLSEDRDRVIPAR